MPVLCCCMRQWSPWDCFLHALLQSQRFEGWKHAACSVSFYLIDFYFFCLFLFNLVFGCGVTMLLSEYGIRIFYKVILSTFWGGGMGGKWYKQIFTDIKWNIFILCTYQGKVLYLLQLCTVKRSLYKMEFFLIENVNL